MPSSNIPELHSGKKDNEPSFQVFLKRNDLNLSPLKIETLQVNVGKLCNQACRHCHVDASPLRTEQMDMKTVQRCLEILAQNSAIQNLDITGGAPELNPHFEYFVIEARKLGKKVMVRHNLTVTLDGHPVTGQSKRHLPGFFAEHGVEVISSLPYYQEYFTDQQRGKGVFQKSLESMLLLNEKGYGKENSGLVLDLVYNPAGAFLPPSQESLEKDFKKELREKYGILFNRLFTITNMPIHRFKEDLSRRGLYGDYMEKLMNAFNPKAAEGVMCRSLISVGYDGKLYDCDFNQMLEMQIHGPQPVPAAQTPDVTSGASISAVLPVEWTVGGATRWPSGQGLLKKVERSPLTVFDFDYEKLLKRSIDFDRHCFGCTAGSGSSCGGTTV